MTAWSPEAAAKGHRYKGPGYCQRCGVAERLHDDAPQASPDWTAMRREDFDTDVPLTLFDPPARTKPTPDPVGTLDLLSLEADR